MDNPHQKNITGPENRLSRSAYFVMLAIFFVMFFAFLVTKFLVPASHQLLYATAIATITLLIALCEQTVIRKSIFTLLLFLALPFFFASISLILWFSNFHGDGLDLWLTFVFWDSLLLSTLLIFFYLVRKKGLK